MPLPNIKPPPASAKERRPTLYYLPADAQRIQAKVSAILRRKFSTLDLFCKVTPKCGEPYFVPNNYHKYTVDAVVNELGIVGQLLVLPEPKMHHGAEPV